MFISIPRFSTFLQFFTTIHELNQFLNWSPTNLTNFKVLFFSGLIISMLAAKQTRASALAPVVAVVSSDCLLRWDLFNQHCVFCLFIWLLKRRNRGTELTGSEVTVVFSWKALLTFCPFCFVVSSVLLMCRPIFGLIQEIFLHSIYSTLVPDKTPCELLAAPKSVR